MRRTIAMKGWERFVFLSDLAACLAQVAFTLLAGPFLMLDWLTCGGPTAGSEEVERG